jgi:IS1 family transposase
MALSFGSSIAKYDKDVDSLLAESDDYEKSAIDQYKKLKQFIPQKDTSYKKNLLKIVEQRNLDLKNKLQIKERQNEALLRVLEYLSTLEKKQCKINIKELIDKITDLEGKIAELRNTI